MRLSLSVVRKYAHIRWCALNREWNFGPADYLHIWVLKHKASKLWIRQFLRCYDYQSALRHVFAWKTGNDMHFMVSHNIVSWLRHNNDVIYCWVEWTFSSFLVVQNCKSEAEWYMTGTQLKVWNTAIALFWVQHFITDLPQFQSQPQTSASRGMEIQNWLWWWKYLFSKSPREFKVYR